MSELLLIALILILLVLFRKPLRYMFSKAERVSDSINNKVDLWCQEMDTETLKEYTKLKEKGKIDTEARSKLKDLLNELE